MSYSKFTLKELNQTFGINPSFQANLFTKVSPREASDWLKTSLIYGVELALQQDSEKARSELIISPVFVELRNQADKKISIFSGIELTADRKLKLTGECDFLISRSPQQMFLSSPIVVAVEAKRQDFEKGHVQCLAEMIAVRIFNEREGTPIERIYGTVTTGNIWQFLMLEGDKALIETVSFDIREDLERILGILWAMTFDEVKK
jgi:hypothetical protein